jgi:phenylalanyl-tRNA synthetase beta chain
MKISLQSLSRWVKTGQDVPALSHALTMAGLEIEGQSSAAPAMSGIVVAEVLATNKHPDAEKLSVCSVHDGQQELQIVCGASNVRAGIKVPLATVGARLPGGMQIKQAKLRGIESFGMLCSAKELGLAEESQGLLELPADVQVGQDIVTALALNDTILEINLTPNRGDCMSVLGVAREVAAQQGTALQMPVQPTAPVTHDKTFPVTITSQGCGKFLSRIIKGVNPAARSPWWLQEYLRRAGVRSINAIVDITNYVMLELGQPMHAYDLNKLNGGIVVRQANEGEQLTLLDGRTINLKPDVLVIADQTRAIGFAGVMGGQDTAISDETTDVLLEVAFFEPDAIAGRGRRYGLVTDASQRFERGVDFNLQTRAIELATELLLSIAKGAAGPVNEILNGTRSRNPINLRHNRLINILGCSITNEEVRRILLSLGMRIANESTAAQSWQVVPPSWRFDIAIEEDLIEEVARVFGYDQIPARAETATQTLHKFTESRISTERCALLLVDRGYQEAITYSFTDPTLQQLLFPNESSLALRNPISAEMGVMRLSLWPGLIQSLQQNQKRQQARVRLFETGRKFSGDGTSETQVIAGIASGLLAPKQWGTSASLLDFFDIKGDVEALLGLTGKLDEFSFEAMAHPALHPGQSACIKRLGRPVGWIGALNPKIVKTLDLAQPAFVFELNIDFSLSSYVPVYNEISKLPMVRRDLSLEVDQSVKFADLAALVAESSGPLLKEFSIFDVYQGAGVEKGKKSIALGINLQDTSRTLTDVEVDAVVNQLVEHLSQRLNARLRDK